MVPLGLRRTRQPERGSHGQGGGTRRVAADWYALAKGANGLPDWNPTAWAYIRTRFEALDAVARGFARLPAERRAEQLAAEPKKPPKERKKV